MTQFDPIVPDDLDVLRSQRGYSPGVRTGNLVFVSGMLGRRADLSIVEEPEAQLIKMVVLVVLADCFLILRLMV